MAGRAGGEAGWGGESVTPIPVDYSVATPPAAYACALCGAQGGKLWREYQTFADHIALHCYPCAHKRGEKTHRCSDMCVAFGWCLKRGIDLSRGDQIGWLVPAIPTAEGDTFWGYTAVPGAGVKWWRALPLFGDAEAQSARPAAPKGGQG